MRVIIMQGVPGSGKSTFVSSVTESAKGSVTVVSADHYFTDPVTGEYRFDPAKLGKAHAACMHNFLCACSRTFGSSTHTVIVDNTNITVDQMSPYYLVGRAYEADIEIVRVATDPEVAASRNIHGVPRSSVLRMAKSMQDPPKFWDVTFRVVRTR